MIKFSDLIFSSLDVSSNDEINIVVDGGLPDKMMAKSAATIYRDYNVIWFTGNMYGLSENEVF